MTQERQAEEHKPTGLPGAMPPYVNPNGKLYKMWDSGAFVQRPKRQAMQAEGQAPQSLLVHCINTAAHKASHAAERQTHLDFLGAFWSAADITVRHWDEVGEAVTARLVHQIPRKNCGVVLVQPVVDGVAPVDHCINVVLEQAFHIWVCEERVVTLSARPLDILHHKSLLVTIIAG